MRITVLLLCIGSGVPVLAQTAEQKQPDSLIKRACAGESAAAAVVEEAAYSQVLRRMMHDPDCSTNVAARFALAKREDHEALQFYACKSLADKLEIVGDLLTEGVPFIGGEFTVEIYRFRESYSRNLTCISQTGNIRLSPSSTR
jgi:hypothetical protein